jgi:prepilin-type N-terminal cleavage/methylation domain-containing protein
LQQGFSLLEMLIVLSIVSILAMVAWPNFKNINEHFQAEQLKSALSQALFFAQKEAQLRHGPVSLCLTDDRATCAKQGVAGFLIFGANHSVLPSSHQKRTVIEIHMDGRLHWRAYPYYRDYLLFLPFSNDNGTFWYCQTKSSYPSWAIAFNKMGNMHLLPQDAYGQIRDARGELLRC